MAVSICDIRSILLPGLYDISGSYGMMRQWETIFAPKTPHIWVPKLTLPEAVAAGAAAVIIKNPEVTRRFWSGWFPPSNGVD